MLKMELLWDESIDYLIDHEFQEYSDEDDENSVLSDICMIFYESKRIKFEVGGFGEDNWKLDCFADLPCIIEEIYENILKLKEREEFELDFYEQGIERKLCFYFSKSQVKVNCISFNKNWNPIPDSICIEIDIVEEMLWKLYRNFIDYAKILAPNLINHPLLAEWVSLY